MPDVTTKAEKVTSFRPASVIVTVTVECPHCAALIQSIVTNFHQWTLKDYNDAVSEDPYECQHCKKLFMITRSALTSQT